MKKRKKQFNLHVNEEEEDLINELREKHAVNLTRAFKIFLKKMYDKLENIDEYDL